MAESEGLQPTFMSCIFHTANFFSFFREFGNESEMMFYTTNASYGPRQLFISMRDIYIHQCRGGIVMYWYWHSECPGVHGRFGGCANSANASAMMGGRRRGWGRGLVGLDSVFFAGHLGIEDLLGRSHDPLGGGA